MVEPSEVTAVMSVFYPQRLKYLKPIVEALFSGSLAPSKLLLWSNQVPLRSIWKELSAGMESAIDIIQSDRNTLLGRYAAMFLAETPYVFVQDDDLAVGPETVRLLVEAASETPYRICGVAGCRLDRFSENPYTGTEIWIAAGDADMVLGRCWAAHRSALIPFFSEVLKGLNPGRSDDIALGMLSQYGAFVIPGSEIMNFDEEGIGLCHEPQHFAERDQMAARLLRREASLVP